MATGDPVNGGNHGLSLQQQITNLGIAMEKGFERMEALLRGFDERIRTMETREAACQPIIQDRVNGMKVEIEAQKLDIKTLRDKLDAQDDQISSLKTKMNIVSWVGTIVGSGVLIDLVTRLLGK